MAVLSDELKPITQVPSATDAIARETTADYPRSPAVLLDSRSSFSGRSLGEAMSGSGGTRTLPFASDTWLSPIRDWKTCLDSLSDAFRTSLADTYKSYERDATPEMIESLFTNKKFRREAVHRMRNASVTRVLSADPQFVSTPTSIGCMVRRFNTYHSFQDTKFDLETMKNSEQNWEISVKYCKKVNQGSHQAVQSPNFPYLLGEMQCSNLLI